MSETDRPLLRLLCEDRVVRQNYLQRIDPPIRPDLERASEILGDFTAFWHAETDPAERRKLINSIFDHVWRDGGKIVAVQPRPAFAAHFNAMNDA